MDDVMPPVPDLFSLHKDSPLSEQDKRPWRQCRAGSLATFSRRASRTTGEPKSAAMSARPGPDDTPTDKQV